MTRLGRRPLAIAVGMLLAFFAWAWLAPVARASCGDYVMMQTAGKTAGDQHHDSVPANPTKPNLPCHGPNCQRGNDSPAAPVSPPPVYENEWGYLLGFVAPPDLNRIGFLSDPSNDLPQHISPDIDHPPRR